MEMTRNGSGELIGAYYDSWRSGMVSFDGARLDAILAEDLDFEGPIAGKRRGAAGFIGGLARFVEGLQAPIEVLQMVVSPSGAAALYDTALPAGSMRFAEFFQLADGRINAIKLVYDTTQYRALGGR
jgi:hypothetical protein